MGRQIILKNDGKIAVFSSVIDKFIHDGITIEEYAEFYADEQAQQAKETVMSIYAELKAGRKPYFQFQMTYEEAKNDSEAHS